MTVARLEVDKGRDMLNHHVHGGPVARHKHDLRQGMMHTAEAGQADSTLDTIERSSEH